MNMFLKIIGPYGICMILFVSYWGHSQPSTYVDPSGVFRWHSNDKEIRLFGVNYTLPFAHGFRAINYIGKDHKQAIDRDVYHMARLGLDAFRIHVWDAEMSDTEGNIIPTAQLDLLDYTLFKMKERGIKTIVTPFKVGGNGYPENDVPAPGFSAHLSKPETYSGETVLKKQERYFTQFLNHINPYTGIAYKSDPDIIALEINNEPQHDNAEIATAYINRMVEVIRKTGFQNPIFYNVSERSEFVDAYCKANIQGCTFQWYPTGLVYNQEFKGNYLPHVDVYNIPFKDHKAFQNKARIIYEFDPADNATSYLYPAMARSFREARFQFAAQFAYDPMDLAFANTEYQTHYLNLAFTPSKALSLRIASAVFHDMDNGQSYGRYPNNLSFGNTHLDPKTDTATYRSKTTYIHTHSTPLQPKDLHYLEHIAGVGSSPIVDYTGTGAYFLDRLEAGVWRLEVMPDVLWVDDPFEKASLKKTVAVVKWNAHNMTINLPDLEEDFFIRPVNDGNTFEPEVSGGSFSIQPGTYILSHQSDTVNRPSNEKVGNMLRNEFVAPEEHLDRVYVVHHPQETIEKDTDLVIRAQIVAPSKIESAEVILQSGYHRVVRYPMAQSGTFSYTVTLPKSQLNQPSLHYYIVVTTAEGRVTYPNQVSGSPEEWDFVSKDRYSTRIVDKSAVVVLFDAHSESKNMVWPSTWNAVKYNAFKTAAKFESDRPLKITVENLNAKIPDMTFKIWVSDKIKNGNHNLGNTDHFVFMGRSEKGNKQKIQVALQLNNGEVFGKIITLNSDTHRYNIPYSELQSVPQVLLPRPFPVFQPYWFNSRSGEEFKPSEIESIQISIGPGIPEDQYNESHILEIERIYLE
ncbi:hypothetical protein [Aestuariivivens sediminis]|uniref:hypothetical protein n=1 Tax=Aestuariivivens sediminis TaxID=2913557 RepID=UPI001F573D44|nr:hypothetical protein [Aestuariivivens sediminis]